MDIHTVVDGSTRLMSMKGCKKSNSKLFDLGWDESSSMMIFFFIAKFSIESSLLLLLYLGLFWHSPDPSRSHALLTQICDGSSTTCLLSFPVLDAPQPFSSPPSVSDALSWLTGCGWRFYVAKKLLENREQPSSNHVRTRHAPNLLICSWNFFFLGSEESIHPSTHPDSKVVK